MKGMIMCFDQSLIVYKRSWLCIQEALCYNRFSCIENTPKIHQKQRLKHRYQHKTLENN